MVAALLRREFRARFAGDPIAEDGLLPLELARLVIGINPVGDLVGGSSLRTLDLEQAQLTIEQGLSLTAIVRSGRAEKQGW